MNYKQKMIIELADKMREEGLKVFIAESGTYGFFTDKTEERVISFQVDLTFTLSGNYKSLSNANLGSGWRISEEVPNKFWDVLYSSAPYWAHGGNAFKYVNVSEHLERYGKSSHYKEYKPS